MLRRLAVALLCLLAPVSALSAQTVTQLQFLDPWDRPAVSQVPGDPVVLRVADAARNADPLFRDSFGVTVTVGSGDVEVVGVTETGGDTGVFLGSVPSRLVHLGGPAAGFLTGALPDTMTAELPHADSSGVATATLPWVDSRTEIVDAAGRPAATALESSRLRLEVFFPDSDPQTLETIAVQVSAALSGDSEELTLVETGPATGLFRGSLPMRLGGAQPGNSVLETTEDAGPPHRFDEVTAAFASSSDAVTLTGSRTAFVASAGLAGSPAAEAEAYAAGSAVFVRVEDHNENRLPGEYEEVYVLLTSQPLGDQETIALLETGRDTGVFTGTLPLGRAPAQSIDSVLQAEPGDTVAVEHQDALGNSTSNDSAVIAALSLQFVDAEGLPTSELLEDGVARLRMFSTGDNSDQLAAETATVEVRSLRSGDVELLELTETGPDTAVFEGSIQLDSGSPASGGGLLETASSGHPDYLPDEVTAQRGAVSATATTVGSRITFLDEHGRTVTLYAAGETVRVRVEDHNRNESDTTVESFSVVLRSLIGGDQSDLEIVAVLESGFDTGVFLGTIPATVAAGPVSGVLRTTPGGVIEAEHANSGSPLSSFARADVGGSVTLFVTAGGAPAEVYLESSRAYLRVLDAFADVSPGPDSTMVQVSSFLAGDLEALTLIETGGRTGVFTGSIRLRLGGAQQGNGTLETTEDPGPPFEADTLTAVHADAGPGGGQSSAEIGLTGSRVAFLDAFGNPADSYALLSTVYLEVEDHNANQQPGAYDLAAVTVDTTGGDSEYVQLLETGRDTGVFRGSLPLGRGPAQSIDQVLQAEPGEVLTAEREDVLGHSSSIDTAAVQGFSIAFVDEAGVPAAVLLENGLARVQVFSVDDNQSAGSPELLEVEVRSLHTGDVELLELTETGPDTGLFAGSIRLVSGSSGGGGQTGGDQLLQTATSGFPAYTPDRVTARRGPASATAATAGSRVTFLDGFGRPAARYAAGETLHLEVEDHNRNQSDSARETFNLAVRSLTAGAGLAIEVRETNFDTGVFRGSLPTSVAGGSAAVLPVAGNDVVEAEHANQQSPQSTFARADIGGSSVLFVTEDGSPASLYLESSRAYLRVIDGFAGGSLQLQVSSALAGDLETLTLVETAPGSSVFEGSIGLDLGGAQPGDGRLQTTEDPGPPLEFDTLRATYANAQGTAAAEAGLTGSRTSFVDATGQETETYAAGSAVYVRVEDHNANQQPGVYDRILVKLRSTAGDNEDVELVETGRDSGLFTGTLPLGSPPVSTINQVLEAEPGETVTAERLNVLGNSASGDSATVLSLSIAFVDEAGAPTSVLLENGTARIQVFSTQDNRDPSVADQMEVEVRSLHTGDLELVELAETGPDTRLFAGSIPLDSGSGQTGSDQVLQTATSGFPEYRPDRVTATRGPASATATTAGSRITFLDDFGRPVPRYAVGETVRVRVEDHNRNDSDSAKETFSIVLRGLQGGDQESVEVRETNFDTGVFTGALPTVPQGGSSPQALAVAGGEVIEAEHANQQSPVSTFARVDVGGSVVLFVTAEGLPAEVYLESSRAYLRVIDGSVTLNPGAVDETSVTLSSFLAGDLETLTLLETGPATRVFEGSIGLALGSPQQGDGRLQTTEDAGLPFEFDTLIATHLDEDQGGGRSSAEIGLLGSRASFVGPAGEDVETYAAGSAVYLRVEDHNANQQPGVYDRIPVRVKSEPTGDQEYVELVETGRNTGVFTGRLPLGRAPALSIDHVLQAEPGDLLTVERDDVLGNSMSSDTATVLGFSIAFVDEAGAPTSVLAENGTARIQVFSTQDNQSPFQIDQLEVEVRSLHTGDLELVELTETGEDTGLFAGSIGIASGTGQTGSDHVLQTATSGYPEYRPDRVTAARGPVSVTATTIGSQVVFLDRFGQPTVRYAAGERLFVRVVDHNRNDAEDVKENFGILVRALASGDSESVTVEETGFDTGVFTGSLAASAAAGPGVLSAGPGEVVEAEHANQQSPLSTFARADIGGTAVQFVTADGNPASLYLESSRAYLRVFDAFSSGDVQLQVSSILNGDLETVTLVETAPGSSVFEGSIGLALGSAQQGDGRLQTTEDAGPPFEFDRLRATYASPAGTSAAEVGLTGSKTSFVSPAGLAAGSGHEVDSYAAGSAVNIRVEDHNANQQPGVYDRVLVRLTSNGDLEQVELLETGRNTGLFTGTVPLGQGPIQVGDDVLQTQPEDLLTARHDDVLGNSNSSDTATVQGFSIVFVDEAGAPTSALLENGRARIEVFSTQDNQSPSEADLLEVEVRSLHTGDLELVELTETGLDTGLFAGSIRIASGSGQTGSDHVLQTATSGYPEYRPDRVTAARGPVSVTAATIGSQMTFLDRFGQPTTRFAAGERLFVRVVDHNRNDAQDVKENFGILVRALASGDSESVTVEETGFDTGVFTGSLETSAGAAGPEVLSAGPGEVVEAEHANQQSPLSTFARADIGGSAVQFVTADGDAASLYLESSRAYLRVFDAFGSGSVQLQVSSILNGDLETVTLIETAPGSFVFEGSIGLALGSAQQGDGRLQTTEDAGPPFEFDRLRATYASPAGTSAAEVGLTGSKTSFVSPAGLAAGSGHEVDTYAAGSAVNIRVEDHNANQQPGVYDRVLVRLTSTAGDLEQVELLETGRNTGLFTGTVPLGQGPVQNGDNVLQAQPGDVLTVRRDDVLGNSSSSDTAAVTGFSIAFVDEAGAPTSVLLENGTARIQVFSTQDNQSPSEANLLEVEVRSLHTGDLELVELTETGVDTGLFAGAIGIASGTGQTGSDRVLQTATSGYPEYRPDRVTAARGPVSATATTIGSQVTFLDRFGRPTTRYAAGERLFVRVVDHNSNDAEDVKENLDILVRALVGGAGGDSESVMVEETGFDTGVFTGSLQTSAGAAGPGVLSAGPGAVVEAEHANQQSPVSTFARADIGGSAVQFVTADGNAASLYLESSRAYLRVFDAFGSGSVQLQVSSFLNGDLETVTLIETTPGSLVFEGSIGLALGSAQQGDGRLQTTEDAGPPFEFDRLRATYVSPAGTSVAEIGLTGSRTAFVDAAGLAGGAGHDVDSYAAGSAVYVRVEDHTANQQPGISDQVLVRLGSTVGDLEQVELLETGLDTGVFTGTVPLGQGPVQAGDNVLQAQPGDVLTAQHDDALGNSFSQDEALVTSFSVGFVEADGAPTAVLVESGVARVRVFSRIDNAFSGAVESVEVELGSQLTGDVELLTLTETGPDSSVFEGSIGIDSTFPTLGAVVDGRIQTTHSGHPEYRTDRVTARRGPVSATAAMVGSRLWFLDLRNQVVDSYPQRSTVRMRLEDYNRGRDPQVWVIGVAVEVAGGDGEPIQLTETGPTTGIFEGEIVTTDQPSGIFDGPLTAVAGDVLAARHSNSTPIAETFAYATVRAGYAPQAVDDETEAIEGQPKVIEVLANDIGTAPLGVLAVDQPEHGTAAVNPDGTVTYTATPGYTGPDSFRYVLADAPGGQARATVHIEVLADNQPPAAFPDGADTLEDQAVVIAVLANDVDPDGDVLTVVSVTQPGAAGTVTINGDNTLTFTPAPNAFATGIAFTYNVSDPDGLESTGNVIVNIAPVNDPPVAADDSGTTPEDQPVTITVLANDLDLEGDELIVDSIAQPANGAVVINPDKTVTYTPAANFSGSDSFSYTISDGNGGTDTGTVTVTVSAANDAPAATDDSASTSEDSPATVAVLANDSDPDGDTLSVTAVTQPANGAVVINPDKTVTYTPAANFSGSDSFSYTISDGNGGSDTGAVTVTVSAANDAPGATDDSASTSEDSPVTVAVLANDSDPDGDTLSVTAVTQPANGAVVINPDKTVTYTPAANFSGSDSFSYTISDGNGGPDTGAVTVTVSAANDAPAATDDSASTSEDSPVTVAVLANDSDPDGDTLAVTAVTQPANGALVINPDKTVTYTPAANFSGSDSFSYTISDGNGGTDTGTVTVTVSAANDAPAATDDSASTSEDSPATVAVLANDSDPDGDTLAVTAVTQPANGAVVINPDKTVTYTPAANFSGSDSFSYTISDGNGGTDTGTVTVTVSAANDAPAATDDSASTSEDSPATVAVLANDSDPDGDTLSVTAVTQPANGAVVINPDKTVTYTPAANFSGSDSFSYTISDGNGGSDTGAVTVTVSAANDAPAATDDSASTSEDSPATVAVLANDSDVDGDTLSVTSLTQPSHGSAVVNPDRTVTYAPAANYNGPDSFSYSVSDGNGGSDSATVSVSVGSGNDAPVANDDSTGTVEDAAVTVAVLANDSDLDGDTLAVSSLTQPSHGSAVLNPNGTITYTPAANYFGPDSFSYTAADGNGGSDPAVVSVSVSPVNDAPVAVDDSFNTLAEVAGTWNVKVNDSDVDGPTLTLTAVTQGAHGTVVLQANQTVTYTPAAGYVGSDSFSYTLSDGAGGTDTATVAVTVTAPPRIASNLQVLYTFDEGTGTTVNDVSGVGAPLNLAVGTPAAVSWGPGFLAVSSATLLQSAGNATKVIAACQASNQITMEAWVDPANLSQTGPAPVVTVSQAGNKRDFTLGQSGSRYDGRLRTSSTSQAGNSLLAAAGSATLNLTHVVYTRDAAGAVRMYVNSTLSASTSLSGNFSGWTAYKLALANEVGGGRPWLGDLHLVAVYSRALSAAEVRQNFLAGAD